MYRLPHQFLGSVTAVSVLLCAVFCACGNSHERGCDDTRSHACQTPGAAAPTATPRSKPHCGAHGGHAHHHPHGHDDHNGHAEVPAGHHGAGESSEPATPAPQDGGGGCQHCQPTVTAPMKVQVPADYSPHLSPAGILPLPTNDLTPGLVALHRPGFRGDLSPPVGPDTLLSLHCALTT